MGNRGRVLAYLAASMATLILFVFCLGAGVVVDSGAQRLEDLALAAVFGLAFWWLRQHPVEGELPVPRRQAAWQQRTGARLGDALARQALGGPRRRSLLVALAVRLTRRRDRGGRPRG